MQNLGHKIILTSTIHRKKKRGKQPTARLSKLENRHHRRAVSRIYKNKQRKKDSFIVLNEQNQQKKKVKGGEEESKERARGKGGNVATESN